MIYVASPYSHKDARVQEHRYQMAEMYVVSAFRQGLPAFSPIYYCHLIAKNYKFPGDAAHWKAFNNSMMRRADTVHVLKLMGWRESKGVQYELFMAGELGIPVIEVEFTSEKLPEGVKL